MKKHILILFISFTFQSIWAQSQMALAKYNESGILMPEFDGDGKLLYDYTPSKGEIIESSWRLDDGSFLVCGTLYFEEDDSKMFVTKFSSKGVLDNQFGSNGTSIVDFYSGDREFAKTIAVDNNGRIIIAGGSISQFALARLNPNGSLDTSFDEDGKVLTDFSSCWNEFITAIGISGNRIYVGGIGLGPDSGTNTQGRGSWFALAKYKFDGSLDTSFDGDGKVLTDFSSAYEEKINDLKVMGNKIIVGGNATISKGTDTSYNQFALAKYNLDGSLDLSFDEDGKVLTDFASCRNESINSIEVLPNGSIIAAGSGDSQFALAMYNANGILMNSFDGDGKVLTEFSSGGGRLNSMVVFDGEIYVGGYVSSMFALAKYNLNGQLLNQFDGDGKVLTDFSSVDLEVINSIFVTEHGEIIAAGYAVPKSEVDLR